MAIVLAERAILDVSTFLAAPPRPDVNDNELQRRLVGRAANAVGRLSIMGPLDPGQAGTAFFVGNRLAVLARFSAEAFVNGVGDRNLQINEALRPTIAFGSPSERIGVTRARFVHPYFDVALVELERNPVAEPLVLEAVRPLQLTDREIVVIGFPQSDGRSDPALVAQVAPLGLEGKKIQPGRIRGLTHYQHHGLPRVSIAHDASTLGGNSGSPVLDVMSGRVLGIHFAGVERQQNFAIPCWELGRDIRVRSAGLPFSEPLCPWANVWQENAATPEAIPGRYLLQEGNKFIYYDDGVAKQTVVYSRNKHEALSQLLLELFVPPSQMREFLSNWADGFEAQHEVNWEASGQSIAVDLTRALSARGLIDREFFDRLGRRAGLRGMVVHWLESIWETDDHQRNEPPPVVAERTFSRLESAVRADADRLRCRCHEWPATLDPVRHRVVPSENLHLARECVRAVASVKLSTPVAPGRGLKVSVSLFASGFLIDPQWVLAAAASVQNKGVPLEVCEVDIEGVRRQVVHKSALVDEDMGWALIQLASPITDITPAILRTTPLVVGEPVALLASRRDGETFLSFRDTCIVEVSDDRVRYVVSHIAVASAFAVVDAAWRVIAINVPDRDAPDGRVHTQRCCTGRTIGPVIQNILRRGIAMHPTFEAQPEIRMPATRDATAGVTDDKQEFE